LERDILSGQPLLQGGIRGDRLALAAAGAWTADHARELETSIDRAVADLHGAKSVDIDMRGVERLDTFGAWLLERLVRAVDAAGAAAKVVSLPERYRGLVEEARQVNRGEPDRRRGNALLQGLETVGRAASRIGHDIISILQMFGETAVAALRTLGRPWTFRLTSMVHHLDRVGWRAVPIILLITFLIGCILAQQGIFHFRRFGAEIYVVDMTGILILREVGVLIVTVMVAGRSGSAYTAELGAMKMREEVDALRTMGLDPLDVLVLPRIVALVIAVPLLTFLGMLAALYGSGLVCWVYGGISPDIFLTRLREAISLSDFKVGMTKAPFMAMIIGVVASVEGLQVKGSAESLGLNTTASVVKAIFLVIVLDGLFAMFFAAIGT
jgi:phospholipid/cholesterol/gamma-HCH transport system permease protein